MLNIKHHAGFFSCCSIKLHKIVEYIHTNKKLPKNVDSSGLYKLYKKDSTKDVTFDFFKHYKDISSIKVYTPINYRHTKQWDNYCLLDYKHITPLIKKYFSPSDKINTIVSSIENKYNLVHDNILAVYYRGTDKYLETKIAPFDEFYKKIQHITNENENIKVLIQSDSAQFIDYIHEKQINNVIIINENKSSYNNKGIHNENTRSENYNDMLNFLSTIIIISKCKYIICSSGNCSIWAMLYRGHCNNIYQYIDGYWKSNR